MRRVRSTIATVAALALLATACGDDASDDGAIDEDVADVEDADPGDDAADATEDDTGEGDGEGADGEATDGEEADGTGEDGDAAAEPEAAPTPVEDRMEDPCAVHGESSENIFIDVVSPVDGQEVDGDEVALIGCANVHEGTVSWRLLDADDQVLDDGFTTADCAITCNGTFDDTVPLDAASGEDTVVLEVFSENVADEGPPELELRSLSLVLG